MESLNKISEDVQNLINVRFKPLLNLAEALAEIGNLDNAKQEAINRKEKAYHDASAAEVILAKYAVSLEKAKAEVEEQKAEAESVAIKSMEYKDSVYKEVAAFKEEALQSLQVSKKLALDQVKTAKNELFIINAEVENAKEDLAKFKAELEELKKKVSAFVKG